MEVTTERDRSMLRGKIIGSKQMENRGQAHSPTDPTATLTRPKVRTAVRRQ